MNKLKAMREKRGLSQAQLSEQTGISYRTLQYYEQNQLNFDHCKIDKIMKTAIVLQCDVEDIIEDPEIIEVVRQYQES